MTVEEAKNQQCPLCIDFTEQGLSKSGLKITDYVYANCIADRCMMWRWNYDVDGIKNKAVAETIAGELIYDDVRVKLPSTTEGYCGLAGKEGAE